MVVDGHVGIQGNGNQDTQSWFHSMEVNLIVDCEGVCREWLEALETGNANTVLFGAVNSEDGVWRDGEGKEAEGGEVPSGGKVAGWAKGVVGAVRRVRGTGGF